MISGLLVFLGGRGVLELVQLSVRGHTSVRSSRRDRHELAGRRGAVGVLTTLALILGVSAKPLPLVAPVMVILAVCGVAGVARETAHRRWASATSWNAWRVLALLPGLTALAVGGYLAAAGVAGRVVTNDEYATWAYKGRLLASLGHVPYPPPGGTHWDYPLLVPALDSWMVSWSGTVGDHASHLATAMILVAALFVVADVVRCAAGPIAGAVAVVAVAATTGLAEQSLYVLADVPVASFSIVLVALCALWLGEGATSSSLLGVAAVAGIGAVLTKNEGLVFAFSVLAAAILAAPRRRRRTVLLAAAPVLAAIVPWTLWTRANDFSNDLVTPSSLRPGNLEANLDRLPALAAGLVHYWPGPGAAGLTIVAAAAVLAVWRGCWRPVLFLFATTAFALGGLMRTYVLAPMAVVRNLPSFLQYSAPRVLMFPAMVMWLTVPLLFRAASRDAARGLRRTSAPALPSPRTNPAAGHTRPAQRSVQPRHNADR